MLGSSKAKGDSDFGKMAMLLIGTGMIVVAATCFKDVPLIGTVFLMPGDSMMEAKMADPLFRDALFLLGGMFTAYGIQLHIKIGFTNPLKQGSHNAIPGKPVSRRKPWIKPWERA
jgi:hypothetical protein